MTDHDRGAYTPPTDEALAFDARRQSERRPAPMTLVGSVVVVVVMIVGVAVVYRGGVRNADEAPRPVGQPVVSVKTPPPPVLATVNSVGAEDRSESKSVAAAPAPPVPATSAPSTSVPAAPPALKPPAKLAVRTDTPTFAPAPEQPAPRPAPAPKTLANLDKPTSAAGPSRVKVIPPPGRPIRSVGGLDSSEVAAAGMTGSAPAPKISPASPPSPPYRVAVATPRPASTAAKAPSIDSILARSSGPATGPVVQIGAFSSAALSDQGYADVSRIMAGQMAGKAKHVMTVDHEGATLFRTWVSGFGSRAQAQAFCAALKARSKPCFVKG
jgi:hypothetical protein